MGLGSLDLRSSGRDLFKRCVQCPNTNPSCPICSSNQICSFNAQTCSQCASTSCVSAASVDGASTTAAPAPSGGSAAGPIAGGVVGGLLVIVLLTFFVWKYCVKRRKQTLDESQWRDINLGSEKDAFGMHKDNRASTHTVASLASTVYTRASNIIQIAYIPGVTNRSLHSSADLVPPVPPIPAISNAGSNHASPQPANEDQHFFLPSDLRNSAYSNFSDRTRNSIASTVYRNHAIVSPVPAQMVTRVKAQSVSVKSSSKNSPTLSRSTTPPMPSGPIPHHPGKPLTRGPTVARVGQPRPVEIRRKASQLRSPPIYELDGSGSETSSPYLNTPDRRFGNASPYSQQSSTFEDASDDEDSGRLSGKRLIPSSLGSDDGSGIRMGSPVSPAELSAHSLDGTELQFQPQQRHKKKPSLNKIIEEAALSASRTPLHGGLGSYEQANLEAGPFADSNAARTP